MSSVLFARHSLFTWCRSVDWKTELVFFSHGTQNIPSTSNLLPISFSVRINITGSIFGSVAAFPSQHCIPERKKSAEKDVFTLSDFRIFWVRFRGKAYADTGSHCLTRVSTVIEVPNKWTIIRYRLNRFQIEFSNDARYVWECVASCGCPKLPRAPTLNEPLDFVCVCVCV